MPFRGAKGDSLTGYMYQEIHDLATGWGKIIARCLARDRIDLRTLEQHACQHMEATVARLVTLKSPMRVTDPQPELPDNSTWKTMMVSTTGAWE